MERPTEENEFLTSLISDIFVVSVFEMNKKEIDRVAFFVNQVTLHKSFITKIYEYYVKYSPGAADSELHKYTQLTQPDLLAG